MRTAKKAASAILFATFPPPYASNVHGEPRALLLRASVSTVVLEGIEHYVLGFVGPDRNGVANLEGREVLPDH